MYISYYKIDNYGKGKRQKEEKEISVHSFSADRSDHSGFFIPKEKIFKFGLIN